ncbi:MAG: molybdopterin molybdotransferase [Candidatus Poriferisodalaceae bacterium]|jgi:molybdopterin molybdotransferase
MLPLEEVRDHILSKCPARPPALVPVADALGLVIAADIVSTVLIPPFDNTAMDGFAVRSADVADAPVDLTIVETIPAGHAPAVAVGLGQASRIMTGALMPEGADAVVMVERTRADGDVVTVEISVPAGNHVRPAGDDIGPGNLVFEAGTVLTAGGLGVLCSLGLTEVLVYPRLVVGVMSTGDELVDDGSPLAPGQIRDSNRRTLLSLLADLAVDTVDLGLAIDDEEVIEEGLRRGAIECDAILTSGGVSMGDFDYVKEVLSRIADMRWMQVAIKPAKPLAFGLLDGVPVFGLPGNPVSAMVSYELFARPGLRSMQGHREPVREPVLGVAGENFGRHRDGKTHFLRIVAAHENGRFVVRSAGGQGSHMLWAMAKANALAIVPDGEGYVEGDDLEVLLLQC